MSPIIAELPFPPEAIIPIIIVLAQLVSYWNNKNKTDEEESIFTPTDEERDIILRRQQQGEYWDEADDYVVFEEEEEPIYEVQEPPPVPSWQPPALNIPEQSLPEVPADSPILVSSVTAKSATTSAPTRGGSRRRRIDQLLSTRSAARDAILLTEILGTPVSMRSQKSI